MVWEHIYTILIGAGAGLMSAFVGYIKNMPKGDQVNWKKALPAISIGTLAGIYAAWKGIDMFAANAFLATSGVTMLVNHGWSALWKFIANKKTKGVFIAPVNGK